MSWSEDGSPPNFPLHDSFAHRRWWRSSYGCGPGSTLLCNISLLSSWAAMTVAQATIFLSVQKSLASEVTIETIEISQNIYCHKIFFCKKLAIYSCYFCLKRDNPVFECFSPFPFSSGHAGHHRKSKREVEAKGKHIDKVNVPRKWKFGAKPKFWHQCINARVRGAAWTVQNMKQSKICKNK